MSYLCGLWVAIGSDTSSTGLDPIHRAESYRLIDVRYQFIPVEESRILRSEILEGFWLDVEWLFAEKLPNEFHKLQETLNS